MNTRALSEQEFGSTFAEPMRRVQGDEAPPFDFWDYFEAIPGEHFGGHDCSEGAVEWVYADPSGRFQHVLVNSEKKNVFMVIVLDCDAGQVFGHRLLDLNKEYGVETENKNDR